MIFARVNKLNLGLINGYWVYYFMERHTAFFAKRNKIKTNILKAQEVIGDIEAFWHLTKVLKYATLSFSLIILI